jgi:8-oxo-dGTP pyrophosphatase MutT (NUDIX family)
MKVRKQSGLLVYRVQDGVMEVLLISSSTGKGKLVLPKGGIEKGMTPEASALKELYEEAGVKAKVLKEIGDYDYVKRGRKQNVRVYLARFTGFYKRYPEQGMRSRMWYPIEVAHKYADKPVAKLIKQAADNHRKYMKKKFRGVAGQRMTASIWEGVAAQFDGMPVDVEVSANGIRITEGHLTIVARNRSVHPSATNIVITYTIGDSVENHIRANRTDVASRVKEIYDNYIAKYNHDMTA